MDAGDAAKAVDICRENANGVVPFFNSLEEQDEAIRQMNDANRSWGPFFIAVKYDDWKGTFVNDRTGEEVGDRVGSAVGAPVPSPRQGTAKR